MTNCSRVCSIKAIFAVSLILFISLTFMGEGYENETFSISGSVYNDANGNSKYDQGDRGIPDVYICLRNLNNEVVKSTDTDFNGNYFFVGLDEGDYYLEKNSGNGWEQILPKPFTANKVKLNNANSRDNQGIIFLDRRIPIEYDMPYVIANFREAMGYLWPGVVWFLVFVFMCGLLYFTVNKLYSAVGKSQDGAGKDNCPCNYLLLFVLLGTTFLGWTFYIFGKPFYIIPLIGIACLAIPLILSISADYNIGSKLDNGEIRKSIVISLTVVYIIFLAISFEKSINEKEMNILSYDADFTMKIDKQTNKEIKDNSDMFQTMDIKAKINSSSEVFATPERLSADFSSNKTEVVLVSRESRENSSKQSGRSVPIPSSSANSSSEQMIPEEVMATFTKNFLYIYILIILFYFGSRFVDEYRTSSTLEKYLTAEKKETDVSKIAAARFAIGDIGAREYKETIDALGYRADKTIEVSKIALSVAIDDVENKYATWIEAKNKEETIFRDSRTPNQTADMVIQADNNLREARDQSQIARTELDTAIANVKEIKDELMNAEN
jgi:hypothetical protein